MRTSALSGKPERHRKASSNGLIGLSSNWRINADEGANSSETRPCEDRKATLVTQNLTTQATMIVLEVQQFCSEGSPRWMIGRIEYHHKSCSILSSEGTRTCVVMLR
jgi:hypothetical protein